MITERMQQALLYRAFIEKQPMVDVDVARWSDPWRTIALLAERSEGASDPLYWAASVVTDSEEAARNLIAMIRMAGQPLHIANLEEMAANLPPVTWLWENWIPRGMLSLLGAYQGTGKSWFVLDLARTIIQGGRWPDGTPTQGPANVIYVEAEGIPQVLNQRAVALGMNRKRLYLLTAEPGEVFNLALPEWRDKLIDAATTLRPALIIVDSLSSVTSNGQNSVEETNSLLVFLVGLANYVNCGLLMIHHLRKPSGGQLYLPGMSIHDFRGSGHITAMARTVLGLSVVQSGKQFSLNGPRRLDLVKTNLGPYPDSLGIEMTTNGERTQFTYGEAPDYERTVTAADSVEAWLLNYLEENGPTPPATVVDAAALDGHGRAMIYRTRKALGAKIVNTKGYRNPKNEWALPHQIEDGDEPEDGDDNQQSLYESEE